VSKADDIEWQVKQKNRQFHVEPFRRGDQTVGNSQKHSRADQQLGEEIDQRQPAAAKPQHQRDWPEEQTDQPDP